MDEYDLVDVKTNEPVHIGDTRMTFRDDPVTIQFATPPRHSSSEGHVTVKTERGFIAEYYASVIGAKFVKRA